MLFCINPHDRLRISIDPAHQYWWAFSYGMQAHENCYIKRLGVTGL
ncbi:hypothetical protein RZ87_18905 [Enterobacter roggenkampii]|nr:hypothetical protein RZ87_18905 [Enterobacter roggenkampii]